MANLHTPERGEQECFPRLDPNVPEGGSRYPDKGCYRVGCSIHGGPSHDYPACAIFRGGKCTCDEADNLCPHCGSEEWNSVTAERGRERDVPFNRCNKCEREWPHKEAA
jgi:hypothetical protein